MYIIDVPRALNSTGVSTAVSHEAAIRGKERGGSKELSLYMSDTIIKFNHLGYM